MIRSHNEQMEKMITIIMELKDKSNEKKKGKEEQEKRKIVEYFSDDDEFY